MQDARLGNVLGHLSTIGGAIALWLNTHGLALLGAAAIVFGIWIQWKTYRLKREELDWVEGKQCRNCHFFAQAEGLGPENQPPPNEARTRP